MRATLAGLKLRYCVSKIVLRSAIVFLIVPCECSFSKKILKQSLIKKAAGLLSVAFEKKKIDLEVSLATEFT